MLRQMNQMTFVAGMTDSCTGVFCSLIFILHSTHLRPEKLVMGVTLFLYSKKIGIKQYMDAIAVQVISLHPPC